MDQRSEQRTMQASASKLRLATAAASAAIFLVVSVPCAQAQLRDTIPSRQYYNGIEELYEGDFRNAQRTFSRSLNGGVKTVGPTGTLRWVDSVCYHAMLGETFYHWGQPREALQQFDQACILFLQYPRWLLRAQFNAQLNADPRLGQAGIPWGAPQRRYVPGRFPTTVPVAQGQLDASQQLQQGGVVQPPQLWPVDVVEIVRCTALAMRRRNELLGPLGPHDAISKNLAATLGRAGATTPNHWSGAWANILRGIALVGIGDREQALQMFDRGLLAGGQFDHPLTCVALLEQGRLALDQGNTQAAANFFTEAGYSAYLFQDIGVIDDSFRLGELTRIAAGATGVNPALQGAMNWARRDRFNLIAARLNLALADELMNGGDWKNAGPALAAGASLLGDARTGSLGNYAQFLEARNQFNQARASAGAALDTALEGQRKISVPLFQVNLANQMFDAQTLPMRAASPVYEALLADPSPADSMLRPLETMAVMSTPLPEAFDRWLLAAIDRKNLAAVLDITDRAKRRRYHNALPWGGRLAAIRDLTFADANRLTPQQRTQQGEIIAKFPELAESIARGAHLREQLGIVWRPPLNDDAQRKSARLWDDYVTAIANREAAVSRVGLARTAADISFPPMLSTIEFQSNLRPGQALLVFHDTPDGMLALLLTSKAVASWNCGPSVRLASHVSQFLREIGNLDGNHAVPVEELAAADWQESGAKLYKAIFSGASIEPAALKELIVVPDGVLWYVPFEAIVATIDDEKTPLISVSKVRYAPTAALAFSFDGAWRRIQRTGIAAGAMVAGDKPEQQLETMAALQAAVPGPVVLTQPPAAPTPILASLLDALVVLDDVDALGSDPLAWSPLPIDRNVKQGTLDQWMALPADGPQRILLPGMHTAAERGGKASRSRRGGAAVAPGDELFYASCGLMSAGADTLLLSRWRVGGQTTLDLMREFAQELPHTAASDAWQRSVQLLREAPVDPTAEPRVKPGKAPVEMTASHPFFWAGYLVVDTGWRPVEAEAPADQPADAALAGANPPAAAPGAGDKLPAELKPAPPAADPVMSKPPLEAKPTPKNPPPGEGSDDGDAPAGDTAKKPVTPPPVPTPPADAKN